MAIPTDGMRRRAFLGGGILVAWACVAAVGAASARGQGPSAGEILQAAGVKGGLIVHLGCGDGGLTAALRAGDAYLVHGLDTDPARVAKARAHAASLGVYGKVSIDRLAGRRLPYLDNLVNLVVSEDLGEVPMAEVMRVLAPKGVAYVKRDGRWRKDVKPRPAAIDEWTHYLHDATNNAVSQDDVIAPLSRMQWLGSPRWTRHHDHMSSLSSLVAAGGRLFYIFDEGSTASVVLPSHWFLIARDAFNGTVLWKRPMGKWFTQLWPLKSGPGLLTRRLVAGPSTGSGQAGEVYVTLDLGAPVTAIDAATGKVLRTYKGSEGTDEILASDGVLFLAVNKDPKRRWGGSRADVQAIRRQVRDERWAFADSAVLAVRAADGEVFWRKDARLSPSTLAADARSVYFHDTEKIVCLDRTTGKQRWASEELPVWASKQFASYFVPTLVAYKDVVLWAGGEKMIPHRGGKDTMVALDAQTGRKLWSAPHGPTGYQSAEDLLVAGGLVWSGSSSSGGYDGVFTGHDPRTGEVKKRFAPDVEAYWFHHRCYRGKATEKYLLLSRTGIEFLDLAAKKWLIHHWVRGACLTGVVPANGMIYAPPHSCACYPEAKVFGFAAMAPTSKALDALRAEPAPPRLEKGPAFDPIGNRKSKIGNAVGWPTYRADAARSAHTPGAVPADLKRAWQAELKAPLSSVTVAEGKCFVASIDTHTLHALDAATGRPAWSYMTGGRIDSPPTIWQGRCLFGSADGYVYCLRADDGKLAWRFRAAPIDQRQTVFEQVESVWPVHGSVLVRDGLAQFVAGRSMFLDGGLILYRLDAKTGRIVTQRPFGDRDPETGKHLQVRHKILQMPVALSDILSTDGKRLYMRSQAMDLAGKRLALGPHDGDPVLQATVQRGDGVHLFAPYGLLDGSWFHRSYWVYGRSFSGGHAGYSQAGKFAPAGRILAVDDRNVYGYARKPKYLRWTTPLEYHLFATDKQPPELPAVASRRKRRAGSGSWIDVAKSDSQNPAGKPLAVEAWAKADKPGGVVVARGGPAHGYALFLKGGRCHFAVRVGGSIQQVAAKKKIGKDWVHLAGVLTAEKKLQVYVNGELAAAGDANGFIASDPAQDMQIGADADSGEGVADYRGPFAFTGLIDEVRVYLGTVTAEEIARHAAEPGQTAAKDAKLAVHLTFEKGKAQDQSGNNNHGTLAAVKPAKGKVGGAMRFTGRGQAAGGGKSHFVEYHWSVEDPPVVARAMIVAGRTLFVAGPPDVADEDAAVKALDDEGTRKQLAEQDAALAGRRGALLLAVATADGKTVGQLKLDAPPRWDGLAAAGGRLYLATVDGKVLCLTGK